MKVNKKIDLSLVLPCYNESGHLKNSVEQIIRVLTNTIWNWELIFVDDKSLDNTAEIIGQIIWENQNVKIKKIFHSENFGSGKTISDGIKIAEGEVAGFIDADLEVAPYFIPEFVQKILDGAALAIGERKYSFRRYSLGRYFLSKVYSLGVQILFKLPFRDINAGYKFFRRSKILPILNEIEDKEWFWDAECVIRAHLYNFKIDQVPVIFIRRFDKKSTVKIFWDTIDCFCKLIKFYYKIKIKQKKDEK